MKILYAPVSRWRVFDRDKTMLAWTVLPSGVQRGHEWIYPAEPTPPAVREAAKAADAALVLPPGFLSDQPIFEYLRDRLPCAAVYTDAALLSDELRHEVTHENPHCLHVSFDDPTFGDVAPNAIGIGVPLDESVFYPPPEGAERDIDVLFIGVVDERRRPFLEALRRAVPTMVVHGREADRAHPAPISWYADQMRRAKIVVNFSGIRPDILPEHLRANVPFRHHLKGRAIEALACGAALAEENGDHLVALAAPRHNDVTPWIEWDTTEELVERVLDALASPDDLAWMWYEGPRTRQRRCGNAWWWRQVEERLGFEAPVKALEAVA